MYLETKANNGKTKDSLTYKNFVLNLNDSKWRPPLEADVFAVLFMNELKNLTNVVIGKLGKFVQKQKCSHDLDRHHKKFTCQSRS
jgi:hypothetical protein